MWPESTRPFHHQELTATQHTARSSSITVLFPALPCSTLNFAKLHFLTPTLEQPQPILRISTARRVCRSEKRILPEASSLSP